MKLKQRSDSDRFLNNGKPAGFSVGEFWRWGVADLAHPTILPWVAEYVVRQALNSLTPSRDPAPPAEVRTPNGARVRVVATSARPTVTGSKRWRVSFDVTPDNPVEDSATPRRLADVYVFCLLDNQRPVPNDPLELSRWKFFVLPTHVLDRVCPEQRSINRDSLEWLNPMACNFEGLADAVDLAFEAQRTGQTGKH